MSDFKPKPPRIEQYLANAERLLNSSQRLDTETLIQRSPVPIPEDPAEQFALTVENLFHADEIVELKAARPKFGASKTVPSGPDLRRRAEDWIQIAQSGSLEAILGEHQGAFMRINPVKGTGPGSGAQGVTKDSDIARFDHLLIEHDAFPLAVQVSLLAALALPICVIVASGGNSIHGWVKLSASNAEEYAHKAQEIQKTLRLYFGFDPSTGNPSRLSRVPGIWRREAGQPAQRQRLLYLNPTPDFNPIAEH